jgi:hypothetical protein
MDAPPAMAAAATSLSVGGGGDAAAAAAAAVASTSTGVKEASSVEETRPTSTIAGLAKEAAQLFHSRSYQGCLLILNQLLLQNEADPKVKKNIKISRLTVVLILFLFGVFPTPHSSLSFQCASRAIREHFSFFFGLFSS